GEAMAGELILIVEDHDKNRKLVRDVLQVTGYRTAESETAEDGLRLARELRPALILMDIQLPGMNGIEALGALRADPATRHIPVVMVTALDPSEERVKGLEAGADDFLTKPINQPELLARVRSLLRVKTLHDTVQSQAAELAELNRTLTRRVEAQVAELERLS